MGSDYAYQCDTPAVYFIHLFVLQVMIVSYIFKRQLI